jgi:hypothetical protein
VFPLPRIWGVADWKRCRNLSPRVGSNLHTMSANFDGQANRREENMKTDGTPFQVKTKAPVKPDAMPRMPHERDESDDSQQSGPREDMMQAYEDIERGLKDTDLREQRGVEKTVEGVDVERGPEEDEAGQAGGVEGVEKARRGSPP